MRVRVPPRALLVRLRGLDGLGVAHVLELVDRLV